jgi:hypothetical protein
MSTKVSSWVWHECPLEVNGTKIHGRHLIVLLALADISDDNGNCVYSDRDGRTRKALAKKTRLSESTFYRSTSLLEELGLLTIRRVGLQNHYRINMAPPEAELSTGGQNDLLTTTGQGVTSDLYYRSTVTSHKTFNVDKTISPVGDATIERKPQGDDRESLPLGWRARRLQKHLTGHLDIDALAGLVGPVFVDISPEALPRVLQAIAWRVLAKPALAGTKVERPTSYVATAIRNEPDVYRKLAFTIEAAA